MTNQTETEAQLSAKYVENYLDCVENVPNDLQRHLTRLRELDVSYRVSCLEVNTNGNENIERTPPSVTINEKDLGSPQITQQHAPPFPPPDRAVEKDKDKGERGKTGGQWRWAKPPRRSRNKAGINTDGADSSEKDIEGPIQSITHKKGIGKKKKRKAHQVAQRSESPPEEADAIGPDEPRYCLCDQISFGEMILCDNDLCPIEWFHFSCVALTTIPKGKWFCPKCRGDRPNVVKLKDQFLKELEGYNKEKEEKA